MNDCEVCLSPLIATVHSMREMGSTFFEIADATALDAAEVEQHFSECCVIASSEPDSLTASDERLKRLQEKIALVATAGGLQGDLRTQVSALSLSLRAELEVRSALAERAKAEKEAPDPNDIQVTVAQIDALLRSVEAHQKPGEVDPYLWLIRLQPATVALFRRISANPMLLAAIQEFEMNFIPPRPNEEEPRASAND